MEAIKKNYLVEKYKDMLEGEDLKKFEEGLEQSSEHALSDLIDLDFQLKSEKKTLFLGIFLGAFGANRLYLGEKKFLGYIRLGLTALVSLIAIVFFSVTARLAENEPELAFIFLIVSIVLVSVAYAGVLAWWIAEIFLCRRCCKEINRDMLLAAAFSQPGPDTEKTRNYHADTYKTMCFHDKFKKEIHRNDKERFKSAVYYSTDDGFAPVENLQLKSRKIALVFSIFFGFWGAGSFYLGYSKRGVSTIIKNVSLLFAALSLGGTAALITYICGLFGMPANSVLPIIFSIILGLAQLVIYIIILNRYWKEITYCYDQARIMNSINIINTLSKYSVNRITC